MKLLYSWLAEYVDLAAQSEDEVVDALARLGLPVEHIERSTTVPGVVTARVERTERHPDAAKVIRVWVTTGDGRERHVWCGASNFGPGDVVPLATLGTVMPDGRTIERRGILGVDSEGMLCSARELGLGDDHAGILVLPADTPLGRPYGEALGLVDDAVLDVDVTRNRPDCYSYVGVARDLAAGLGVAFTPPTPPPPIVADGPRTSVEIVAGDACGRFTSTVLVGVRVAPSAPWMQRRLTAAGMRPINNIVDVSNYVMLELGQPNHAYDLATLGGAGFRIRMAGAGEALVTLDGITRTLGGADLVIADAEDRPIGLAGIMGGATTEISDSTTAVALEMAWFEPVGIARSVVRSNLRSEASVRFERGVDPYIVDTALARFTELLAETCPELAVSGGTVDVRTAALPDEHRATTVRVSEVARILGTAIPEAEIVVLLAPIGFTTTATETEGVLAVAIPSWRPDCDREIDVIEEIARHYGYERLGARRPRSPVHGRLSPRQQRRRQLRAVLLGLGITEVLPNPFLAPDALAQAGLGGPVVRITNPLVAEESVLRPSLRPALLKAVAFNASHRRAGVALFEIGHVYPPGDGELPDEYEALGVVLAGRDAPDAVRVWREVASSLGLGARVDQDRVPPGLHPTRSATLVAGRDAIGAVGEVAPEVLDALAIDERVAVLELDLRILEREPKTPIWKPTSRHPSSDLDLAFVLPDDVPAEKLAKAIRQSAGSLLVGLDLFDTFRGDSLGEGRRSLAYRLRLQAPDRNLTDQDIAAVRDQVTAGAAKLGATRRG